MGRHARLLVILAISLISVGCDQISALTQPAAPTAKPSGFPEDLTNLMTKTLPVVSGRIGFPRIAVALTGTHENIISPSDPSDCGHFELIVWSSNTDSQSRAFDSCVPRSIQLQRYNLGNLPNTEYMMMLHNHWGYITQYGGKSGPDYQPVGLHWNTGPKVAQFFVPAAWVEGQRTESQTNLVEAFLAHLGIYGGSVDPRVWYYQVDGAN